MTIPAKFFEPSSSGPQFSNSEIWRHEDKAKEHIFNANKNGDLPSRVLAQWQMIQAQRELSKAEYLSYQVCPRAGVLRQMTRHENAQRDNLNSLRNQLYGSSINDLFKIHGMYGVYTYFATMAS